MSSAIVRRAPGGAAVSGALQAHRPRRADGGGRGPALLVMVLVLGGVGLGGGCAPSSTIGAAGSGGHASSGGAAGGGATGPPSTGGSGGTGGALAVGSGGGPVSGGSGGGPGSGGDLGSGGAGGSGGSGGTGRAGATGQAGASADAGLPEAAAATGGLSGGGGAGGCPGLFCEDFEKGAIDPTIWDVKLNGGQPAPSVVTKAGLVAHGKYAAHFHANPSVTSYDFIITKNPPAGLRGHHFGRAYFMVTPMPPANHTEFLYAGTAGLPQYRYLEVASAGGNSWQLTYVDLVPPTTGEDHHAGGHVPLAKWFCLEWEFNDTPDQATVYVDGMLDYTWSPFTFGGVSSGLVGGFAAFGFGYWAWHPAPYAFDLYYDDIVLDTKRVGCL